MPTTYVVRQGDCWSKIARQFGFPDYKLLYDDPANAELKAKRPNPNVLRPGDRIQIPDRTPKTVDLGSGRKHTLRVKSVRKALRLKLVAHDGEPLAGESYELDLGDGSPRTGATDGDGKLEELVPAQTSSATLTVGDRVLRLRLGHLNPIAEAKEDDFSGVQGRLKNLGYDPGPADGKYGPRTRAALAIFQSDEGLDPTGEADDATLGKLVEAHGC